MVLVLKGLPGIHGILARMSHIVGRLFADKVTSGLHATFARRGMTEFVSRSALPFKSPFTAHLFLCTVILS
jgi:hypothetical protein